MAALRRIAALDAADLPPMGGGKQVPTSVMLLARYGPGDGRPSGGIRHRRAPDMP